ncbi:hypothetical protein [Paraburkholderia solisilvae]|uniref:Uncharacterized protein n=1 Tax=Paraburkholderia solisilvae TaxID=624376 RepID=A0A6J5DUX0_9BURK|nr:hypothetical protein [Paraburkholderia solisilvae]CAB3756715.1 hypothetical protein LMG29739_02506 [Paraburkholderia solisilvae]
MTRSVHPKKEIEAALKHAEAHGWRVEVGGSHAWGKLYCPYNDDECRCGEFCIACVWRTPRSAGNHANALKRVVDNCATHMKHRPAIRLVSNKE